MARKQRKIATVIFYDQNLNVAVQDRTGHSKSGEKYGFWGGGIEDGETPEQAARRELIEELDYHPDELEYWGKYSFQIDSPGTQQDGFTLYCDLFLAPITDELLSSKPLEGSGMVVMPIDRVLANQDHEFGPVKSLTGDFLKIKEHLANKINLKSRQW